MSVVTQHIERSPTEVFEALVEPRTYPRWLVGAKEIRAVDPAWPQPGSVFHHRVGLIPPLTVDDNTKALGVVPDRRLELEARARPFGRARVTFTLEAVDGGTEVTLEERPIGLLAPTEPLLGRLSALRNRRSLRLLAELLSGTST